MQAEVKVPVAGIVSIHDRDAKGFLAPDLRDLLPLLQPEGPGLVWAVLYLEAFGYVQPMYSRVEESPDGVIVTWAELCEFAAKEFQTIWGEFVGCRDRASIPEPRADGADLYGPCEFVLEAIDSSYWTVYAKDDAILDRFRAAFRDVRDKPLEGAGNPP